MYVLFSSDGNGSKVVSHVSLHYLSWSHNLVYPFITAILAVSLYPFMTTASLWVSLKHKRVQRSLKHKFSTEKLLTVDESIRITSQTQNIKESLTRDITRLSAELETEQQNAKNIMKEKIDLEAAFKELQNETESDRSANNKLLTRILNLHIKNLLNDKLVIDFLKMLSRDGVLLAKLSDLDRRIYLKLSDSGLIVVSNIDESTVKIKISRIGEAILADIFEV